MAKKKTKAKAKSKSKSKAKSPAKTRAVSPRNDWEAQDAVSTLRRAEEIKKDSRLMKLAKKEAKKQEKALKAITKN